MSDDDAAVRCPVLVTPITPGDPARLDGLLARLADPAPVSEPATFTAGTLQVDGRLDLCKQNLGAAGAARVIAGAVASPHARHLLLGTDGLGEPGTAALAAALGDDHGLRTLYLGCNGIDADAIGPLADRLATDTAVRALWLKRNPLHDQGVRRLAAALRRNSALRTVDLTHVGLGRVGLAVLVDALRARPVGLERLYLGGNALDPDDAAILAPLLTERQVGALFLAVGALGDAGVRRLVDALPAEGRVVLGLGSNGISPRGAAALAERLDVIDAMDLAPAPSARVLGAYPNHVGDDGAAVLAAALPGSSVRRLNLRQTGISGRGARMLLDAVNTEPASALEELLLGKGVPRRLKRLLAERLPAAEPPAADVAAIVSVYR